MLASTSFRCLLAALSVAVLTACVTFVGGARPTPTLDPALYDLSILTGQPCATPCWYGLELGKSTKAGIIATAQTLSFINAGDIPEQPYSYWDTSKSAPGPATLMSLKCCEPKGQTCAGLILVDGVLKAISPFATPPLTLGEAVSYLGEPEYVKLLTVQRDPSFCGVALIWKQRGIWAAYLQGAADFPFQTQGVRCSDVRDGKGIKPDLPVGQILYQLPDQFTDWDFPWSGFACP